MNRILRRHCPGETNAISNELRAMRRLNYLLVCLLFCHVFWMGSLNIEREATDGHGNHETSCIRDSAVHHLDLIDGSSAVAPVEIKRIYLLGERNSGTNYIEKVLKQSFYPKLSDPMDIPTQERSELSRRLQARWKQKHPYAYGSPVFEFKHMFRQTLLTEQELETIQSEDTDSLWIFAIRSPCEWADAMYRKPWHLCPMNSTHGCQEAYVGMGDTGNQSRIDFFQSPWNDHVEADLSPGNNYTMYSDVFQLRSFKLRLMEQVARSIPHRVYVTHLNEVEKSPYAFIDVLSQLYGLTPSRVFPKNSQSPIVHGPVCFEPAEHWLAQKSLDWNLEGFFGFSPLDCHVCSSKQH